MRYGYSRQLIAEITDHLNPVLKDFFDVKKNILEFPAATLASAVEDAMNYYFEGETAKENLIARMTVVRKSRNRKKSRWYKTYIDDMANMSLDDKDHPAASVIIMAKTLSPAEYKAVFGDKNINDILKDELKKTEDWIADLESPLTSFPSISRFTSGSIYKSFRTDLILDIWNYILENLDGNIESYMNRFPENLIVLPLFSARQFKAPMTQEGDLLKNTVYDEDGKEILSMTVNPREAKSNPIKIMDAVDRQIFATLLSRIKNSFYYDKKIAMPLNELAKSVTGRKKCNDEEKDRIKKRLLKFTDYSYSYREGKKMYSFNFFDNIAIDDGGGGEATVVCTFGEMLHDSVVQQKLVSVNSNEMRSLENKLSQVLFFAMQKERISAVQKGVLNGFISYSGFLQIARFPSSSKRKNMKEISTALDEFVNQKIAISSYSVDGDIFNISFLPMSDEEIEDLNLENNRWVLESDSRQA